MGRKPKTSLTINALADEIIAEIVQHRHEGTGTDRGSKAAVRRRLGQARVIHQTFLKSLAALDRINSHILDMTDPDACWLWTGSVNPRGAPWVSGATGHHMDLVSQLVLAQAGIRVTRYTRTRQRCGNLRCVNPTHCIIPEGRLITGEARAQ
jgi:hypothetical protein